MIHPAPKPRRKSKPAPTYSSIAKPSYEDSKAAARKLREKQKPIKKKARPKKETARIYGGSYADWIRSLPCVGCGYAGLPSEFAHTETGGTGRKADAKTGVPLCVARRSHFPKEPLIEGCHRFAHRVGHQTMQKVYRVDLKAAAARLWATWLATQGEG
jgi:hypothetical protein